MHVHHLAGWLHVRSAAAQHNAAHAVVLLQWHVSIPGVQRVDINPVTKVRSIQ